MVLLLSSSSAVLLPLLSAFLFACTAPTAAQHSGMVINGSGSSGCTCIDPWASCNSSKSCHNATYTGESHCLPRMFGASKCDAWDTYLGQRNIGPCADSLPGFRPHGLQWCDSLWCYVNTSECQRPHSPSTITWHDMLPGVESKLAYSYEACGNIDDYTESKHYRMLHNRTLRVSYPGQSSSGYTVVNVAKGGWPAGPNRQVDGSVVAFMHMLAAEVGFRLSAHEVSTASVTQVKLKLKSSSSYTQCVHEVALNETDLCIGNFWITNERLSLTTFSGTLYEDEMKLVVISDVDAIASGWDKFWAHLKFPTHPFSTEGWMLVLVTVVYASISLHWIEPISYRFSWKGDMTEFKNHMIEQKAITMAVTKAAADNLDDEHIDDVVDQHAEKLVGSYGDDEELRDELINPNITHRITQWFGVDMHTNNPIIQSIATISGFASSTYYGLLGLMAGDPKHEVQTLPGRLVVAGFAIFAVVILASYTASLASLVMLGAQQAMLSSLDDVIRNGGGVCIREAMVTQFTTRHPEFDASKLLTYDEGTCTSGTRGCTDKGGTMTIDATDQMLNALDSSECVAVIIMSDGWDKKQRTGQHCNKIAVATLFGIANGMPVREDLAESLSFLIAKFNSVGDYKRYETSYRRDFLPAPFSCSRADAVGLGNAIGAAHLLGPFLISSLLTTLGLFLYGGGYWQHHIFDLLHVESEDSDLYQSLLKMSGSALRKRVQQALAEPNMNNERRLIYQHKLTIAVDQLPNKTSLIGIIMRLSGSQRYQDIHKLQKMSISTLCERAVKFTWETTLEDDNWTQAINGCIDHHHGTKQALISLVLATLKAEDDKQTTNKEKDNMTTETNNPLGNFAVVAGSKRSTIFPAADTIKSQKRWATLVNLSSQSTNSAAC